MSSSFKVSVTNYLGHDHEDYLSKIYAFALSNPTQYFEMRAKVVKIVKRDAIGALYDTFYNVLTEGKSGTTDLFVISGTAQQPKYPEQKVNDFCLSASATLDEILNDLCDIVIPNKMNEIMGDKLNKAGKSTLL